MKQIQATMKNIERYEAKNTNYLAVRDPGLGFIIVKDAKVPFVMELLKNFSFIKAKPITPYKAEVLENLNEAVTELNLIN
jgi:hypothetical protein